MRLPSESVVLNAQQVEELNNKLSTLRHDINNYLSLMLAAAELIRHKPSMTEKMVTTLVEQPGKITAAMSHFSTEFEKAFGIQRK